MGIPAVSEFMDKTFVTLRPDINIYEAIDILLAKKVNSAAVTDREGHLVGILSEKDCLSTLINEVYEGLPGQPVSEYMTKDVVIILPTIDILAVASLFRQKTFRRLLVVENDKLIGQITRRDLLKAIKSLKKNKGRFNPITGKYGPKNPTSASAKFVE